MGRNSAGKLETFNCVLFVGLFNATGSGSLLILFFVYFLVGSFFFLSFCSFELASFLAPIVKRELLFLKELVLIVLLLLLLLLLF